MAIEDVSAPEFDSQFTPSQVQVPNYGFTDSAHWVRLNLRNTFIVVALGTVLISVPLAITGYAVTKESIVESRTLTATEEWLSQTEYEVQNVEANDDENSIQIVGYGPLPPASELVSDLQEPIGQEVVINLEIIESQEVQLELLPPGQQN